MAFIRTSLSLSFIVSSVSTSSSPVVCRFTSCVAVSPSTPCRSFATTAHAAAAASSSTFATTTATVSPASPITHIPVSASLDVTTSSTSTTLAKSSIRGLRLGLLGAPGVGKGTYAARLGPYFSIPFISTGDLVRAEIKQKTPLGEQIKAANNSGGLVPDDIMTRMLKSRLSSPDCSNGFILDGYPRRLSQARMLQDFADLEVVLNIELREDLLVQKTMARRVCSKCGHGYNICSINENNGEYLMPPLLPKKSDECDRCHHRPLELIQRADDEEKIVRHRLSIYQQETKPLENYYREKGILTVHSVKKGLADLPVLAENLEKFIRYKRRTNEKK